MPEFSADHLPGMIPDGYDSVSLNSEEAQRIFNGDKEDYEDPSHINESNSNGMISLKKQKLLKYVEDNIIGHWTGFTGPFGRKRAVYCDYTASGRGIIKRSVNASSEDVLIFTGSGTTGAVHKLVKAMELEGVKAKQTVVFVGPFEHHSNILPWKETGATIIRIRHTYNDVIDFQHLEEELKLYASKKKYRIGCFTAAANVTGIITDADKVSALLHKYGALAFWDYATAGDKIRDIFIHFSDGSDYSKDAVYFSPHKFIGGVGTPGVLVAKKKLFTNAVPSQCGGGTVLYVTRSTHFYLRDIEEREEGGTPAIVESIRAGLAFRLKQAIGTDTIMAREYELVRMAVDRWKRNPNIVFLGGTETNRLPIFSFVICHPKSGKLLHHNFVATVLNDLYGIQARGGCACAGPYAQDLLGISEELAEKFIYYLLDEEDITNTGLAKYKNISGKKSLGIMKPGFLRLNLPFFFSNELVAFIILAVDQVAKNGWKLLPQYQPNVLTGTWHYIGKTDESNSSDSEGDSLHKTNFKDGYFYAPRSPYSSPSGATGDNQDREREMIRTTVQAATTIYLKMNKQISFPKESYHDKLDSHVENEDLVWFLRPRDVVKRLSAERAFPLSQRRESLSENTDQIFKPVDRSFLFVPPDYQEKAETKPKRNIRNLSNRLKFKSQPSCAVS
ncbi:Cysteine desulfurase 1, chloroplastic [Holothuria leucospilota]|uniref:Cysteine desulfurase 1, chloroplastic n=1 Tax=Holothuria leucospilota TaxID=206669 RepID=A0A9Q1H894_HOLLE|nr:Cysteine desulfurase 1, chloroplastic [Holothuria leucospilota]